MLQCFRSRPRQSICWRYACSPRIFAHFLFLTFCALGIIPALYADTAPSSPTSLSASGQIRQVVLSWSGVSGATSYNIYRSAISGDELGREIATGVTSPTYKDLTAPDGQASFYVVTASNSAGESGFSNEAYAAPPLELLSVNCGGGPVDDFLFDAGYLGGTTYGVPWAIDTSNVNGSGPASIYQTNRWANFEGGFYYVFTGMQPLSTYLVRLDFAEVYWNNPGLRTFDVYLNQQHPLSNFDIFSAAGGANKAVAIDTPTTTDSAGNIWMLFATDIDNAQVNGIELFQNVVPTAVHVITGSWQPNPAAVGDIITSNVTAAVDNPYHSTNGDTISEHWNWTNGGVWYSNTGVSGSFTPYTGSSAIAYQGETQSVVFNGVFFESGYYVMKVTATVTYHDDTINADVAYASGAGYIGATASDLMTSNSDASPQALAANSNAANAADTPAGKGVKLTEKIDFSGNALVNNQPEALTGQQITATLSGQPKHSIIKSYTWSFSGGTSPNPIKTWDETAPNAAHTTQLVQLTSADLTGADNSGTGITVNPIKFYDLAADNMKVICDVNLQIEDSHGQITTRVDHVISENTIKFLKPTATWGVNPPQSPTGFFSDQINLLMGDNVIWYPITVDVPSTFSGGTCCLVQITTPNRKIMRIPTNGKPDTYVLKIPDGKAGWIAPDTGLDIAFPYPKGFTMNDDGSVTAVTENYQWDVNKAGISGDSPKQIYTADNLDIDDGGNNWVKSIAQDSFTTWLMYKPPVLGSQGRIWVPLQSVTWNWNGTALKDPVNNTWSATGTASTPTLGLSPDIPPKWDTIITGQQYRP